MNKYELIDKVVAEIAKDKGISEGEVGTYDTLMRVAEIAVKKCSIPDVVVPKETFYCLDKNVKGSLHACKQQCGSCKRQQDSWQ